MKFINFFLFLWVTFVLMDPDTDSQFREPTQSGLTILAATSKLSFQGGLKRLGNLGSQEM
jgi:hypothetical protein